MPSFCSAVFFQESLEQNYADINQLLFHRQVLVDLTWKSRRMDDYLVFDMIYLI